MKCNEFREKVADLFDKTIDKQTQAELDEHMKSCPECKAYYDELREAFDMLQPREVKSEERRVLRLSFASSLWKTAAIFIAAAFRYPMRAVDPHFLAPCWQIHAALA